LLRVALLFFLVFTFHASNGQDAAIIERLTSQIDRFDRHDRVNLLNDLVSEMIKPAPSVINSRKALPYAESALELADELSYHYGMSRSMQHLMEIHGALGNRGQVIRLRGRLALVPRGAKIEDRHRLEQHQKALQEREAEIARQQENLKQTESELEQTREEAELIRREIETLDASSEEQRRMIQQKEQMLQQKESAIQERDIALEESTGLVQILEEEREMLELQNQVLLQESTIKALEVERQKLQNRILWGVLGGIAIVIGILLMMYRAIKRKAKELKEKNLMIEAEKKRSDELLLNILPLETANELKLTGKAIARNYEMVTVLLTDFKDFTTISELLSPKELVDEIDLCFSAFDAIITKYGIEKIKTIGDAYLCVHGLPSGHKHQPVNVIKAALEIVQFMESLQKRRKEQGRTTFTVRIGIHSGPLVAGVVGQKKFAYDIWGDTVNTVARMEQNSEPGKINVSATTYNLVRNDFEFISRGKIAAKNKGELEMYFVKNKTEAIEVNS
jgi:adenylate cyclase